MTSPDHSFSPRSTAINIKGAMLIPIAMDWNCLEWFETVVKSMSHLKMHRIQWWFRWVCSRFIECSECSMTSFTASISSLSSSSSSSSSSSNCITFGLWAVMISIGYVQCILLISYIVSEKSCCCDLIPYSRFARVLYVLWISWRGQRAETRRSTRGTFDARSVWKEGEQRIARGGSFVS